MSKKKVRQQGFTLIELMLVAVILVVALCGLLHVFGVCLSLNETSRNTTLALDGAREMLEQIRNHNFDQIFVNYNRAFRDDQLPDVSLFPYQLPFNDYVIAVEVINDGSDLPDGVTNNNLLQVRIVVCWQQKGNRIIGEDTNLNGILDAGEDISSPLNGRIDSPVELITLINRPPS